jgi:hypothetical protein
MPLVDKGFSEHSLINKNVFDVLDYLFSLNRVNELKAAVHYCQSKNIDSDPKGHAKDSSILDHKGQKIEMKSVNIQKQIEEMEDD